MAWAGSGTAPFRPALLTPPGSAPERKVSVLSELRSVSAREGDGATFECTVSEVETAGSWELGGRPLRPGGRVRIRQEGLPTLYPLWPPRCPIPPAQTDPAQRPTSSSDEFRPAAPEAVSPPLPDLQLFSPSRTTPLSPRHPSSSPGPTLAPPSSPHPPQRRLRPR